MAALQNYTAEINAALKEDGVNPKFLRRPDPFSRKPLSNHSNNMPRVNAVIEYENPHQRPSNLAIDSKNYSGGRYSAPFGRGQPMTRAQDRLPNRGSYNFNRNFNKNSNFRGKFYGENNQNSNKTCSLCLRKGHLASESCSMMRNKQGQVVLVAPVQEKCPICFEKTGDAYYHPKAYCFRNREDKKFGNNKSKQKN